MVNGIYARNYDYFPKTYEGQMMMHQPEHGFATFGFSQRMVGRTDGMNEHGLSIGYHFVHRIKPEEGFVCSNICRMVLENCRNTDEAVQFLKQVPHRHSFNYSMYDAGGRRAVVEASPRKLVVRQEDDFWCTNHFITEQLQEENRHFLKDSYRREGIFKSMDLSDKQQLDLFYLFNHDGQGIYTNDYRNWSGTIHTAVYEPASLSIYVGIGGNRPPVKIPFREFLNRERIYIKTIKGKMDTDLDFPFNW
ncbi:C45 family peptidase [Sinobaca sp. H24]|uniref:C45 family autoproteolytic acyltransferase/hydolase n=1 Tax=Sinobaca sp. H24 TaxID=2923376 RepID=UPI002079AE74|nr:C45 family peptidase [Sinobaca sp. H24]